MCPEVGIHAQEMCQEVGKHSKASRNVSRGWETCPEARRCVKRSANILKGQKNVQWSGNISRGQEMNPEVGGHSQRS